MNARDEERIKQLLNDSMPPANSAEPPRDLWPAMQRRLATRPAALPWFDWALIGGLALFIAAFPAAIPVFLYYL